MFSKSSLIVLESLSFTETLYAFDFDGTLSKIVRVPSEARMSRTTEQLIRQLSEKVPVAIVSGRSVEDLRARLGFTPKFLVGNHGLEINGINPESLAQAQRICRSWMSSLKRQKWPSGVEIEDKTFSLAIHYRRSRNRSSSRQQIQCELGRLKPSPRVIQGKLVYNILPHGAPHKGAAVMDVLRRSGMRHVFYIGDDDTDEDVFNLPPHEKGQIMTVRVGKKAASQAGYFIHRQSEINTLLRLMISYHSPTPKKGADGAKLHARDGT